MFPRAFASITVLLGLILGLLLAGCTVGPDFHPPRTTMPAAWVGPAAPTTQPSPVANDLARWWKSFGDPALSSLVERAVQSNLDLQQAQSRLTEARASRGVALAGLGPSLGGNAGFTRSGRGNARSTSLYQAGLDASWEIDVFGGARRNIEAADAGLQAAQEDLNATLVTLTAEVALNYIDLRGFQQQIAIAQQNLKTQRHTADLTRARFQGGLVGALDVANADAQVANTASQVPSLQTSVRQTIYSLSVLLGREPGALVEELSPTVDIPSSPPEVPLGLPSDLLRRRPDIRRSEAQLHAATARIGVATADLLPTFNLSAGGSLQSNNLRYLLDVENRIWSFGPSMNWTLFNSGANLWNIEIQRAVAQQALLTYRQNVLTALQDVENALVASANEQEHRKLLVQVVAANQKAVDLATKLYAEGQTDFLNVLNAQRSLYVSQDALGRSIHDVSTNLVSLYKALGGGWSGQATTQPASEPSGPVGAVLHQVSGGKLGTPALTTQPAGK